MLMRRRWSNLVIVYRVQATDGRGPWRPGWSHNWIDEDAPVGRLSETLMDLMSVEHLRALPSTMAYGCGCRTVAALMEWYTQVERHRLQAFGFYPVRINADVVLAESEWQMLVGRKRPFSEGATRLKWQ
jgi:hypothetical protein